MHVILEYGMGNTASVEKAVRLAGFETCISNDRKVLESAQTIIMPGVGAYQDAMERLTALDLVSLLKDLVVGQKKRFLGFCLGMQVLSEMGYEGKETRGLGFIPGSVVKIPESNVKIPHMGWNDVSPTEPGIIGELTDFNFYFMHSFYFKTESRYVTSFVDYGEKLTASVRYNNIFGAQFHPEKSQTNGLIFLQNALTTKV